MLRRNKHSGDGHMLDIFARGTIHIEDLEVGMRRGLSKIVSDRDMELFGEVTTDRNPVHFDDDYAGRSMFGGRIVHGMLTASLISAVIGERLPGHGTGCRGTAPSTSRRTCGFWRRCGRAMRSGPRCW